MPCFHPRIRVEDVSKWIRAKDGHLYHPARIFQPDKLEDYDEDFLIKKLGDEYKTGIWKNHTVIPCKQCIGCELEYSRQWANRGYLENQMWEQSFFVTITYDEGHLPQMEETIETSDGFIYDPTYDWQKGTLVPKDLTHFMKTVRKNYKELTGEDGIRFMAAGEYGSQGERPHYHLILFNVNLKPKDHLYSPQLINKKMHFKSDFFEKAWTHERETAPRGWVDVTDVSWNDIAYVARYITKKINGPISEHHYAERGQEKEFFRASRMPGIGAPYFWAHYKEIYERDEIIVKNSKGVVRMQPPIYFDKLYEQLDPDRFEEIKKNRKKRAVNLNKIKDETTSLLRLDQLALEEHIQEEKALSLRREFEKKAP